MRVCSLALPLVLVALGLGCGGQEAPEAEETPPAAAEQVEQTPEPAAAPASALLDPSAFTEQAPETYAVKLVTTEGEVILDVTRAWAPKGADRFYNLVKSGYLADVAFFRVIDGFMAQVGLHGDPQVNMAWRGARIADDAVQQSNTRGMVSFATAGPNTRTTQFFINFKNNSKLDGMGFAPFAKVRDMAPIDALYKGYGEGAPSGRGPNQGRITTEGNAYLKAEFPELDYIVSAELLP